MSEATDGVAQAKASTSTSPKLSPPSAGETDSFARSSSCVRTSFGTIPSTSIPASSTRSRAFSSRYCSGSVPIRRSRAPVARWISGHARSSVGSPLRWSWRPMKTIVLSRSAGSASARDQDAVRDHAVVARHAARRRLGRHRRDGDPRVDAVHQEAPEVHRRPHPAEVAVRRARSRRSGTARTRSRRRRSPASSARGSG